MNIKTLCEGLERFVERKAFSIYHKTMTIIPLKMRRQMEQMPYYHTCARAHEGNCSNLFNRPGKIIITWEHSWIYGGKKIQEIWAIIPLCWYHHQGPGENKALSQLISLARATEDDLKLYPKMPWAVHLRKLRKRFIDSLYPESAASEMIEVQDRHNQEMNALIENRKSFHQSIPSI